MNLAAKHVSHLATRPFRAALAWFRPLDCAIVVWLACGLPLQALNLPDHAVLLKAQLAEQIMPYWHDTTLDRAHGGYLLADNGSQIGGAKEKQLVSQTRLIWTFSHAHLNGLSTSERDYLKAAQWGYQFLTNHFLDAVHGGYFWKTDLAGAPTHQGKIMYGQAFVLYALVEYSRASKDPEPLRQALHLFGTLDMLTRDRARGGWIEHFRKDWKPILRPDPLAEVEIAGFKSANTHLHLMEAFTALFRATGNASVRDALVECLRVNKTYFYPLDPAAASFHRELDFSPVRAPSSSGLSYGHNVEFAWLMMEAEKVIRWQPSWKHFFAYIDHALRYGTDERRGGVYERGVGATPATGLDKIWWVQAEMLAALTYAAREHPHGGYEPKIQKLLDFVQEHVADKRDAVWADTVAADGTPKKPAKAHNWKANYHDVRAIVKFTESFKSRPNPATTQR